MGGAGKGLRDMLCGRTYMFAALAPMNRADARTAKAVWNCIFGLERRLCYGLVCVGRMW